jgi:hypothetical protein
MIWAVDRVDDRSGNGLAFSLLKSIQHAVNMGAWQGLQEERQPYMKQRHDANDRA